MGSNQTKSVPWGQKEFPGLDIIIISARRSLSLTSDPVGTQSTPPPLQSSATA